MTIVICDDEQIWIERAREIQKKVLPEARIILYSDPIELLTSIEVKKECPDVIILDIDMPTLNGFDVAERIKKIYKDLLLIFYTAHEQYVFDSFVYQPFRYVRKQNVDLEMKNALLAAKDILESRTEKYIELRTKEEVAIIKQNSILFFETAFRRCDIHTLEGKTLNVRKTIRELRSELDNKTFIEVNNGIVANIAYIEKYTATTVILTNKVSLPVSRPRYKTVKGAILEYWRNRL